MNNKAREIIPNMKAGFFWGLGFAIAVLLTVSLYRVIVEQRLAHYAKELFRKEVFSNLEGVWDGFKIEVHDLYSADNQIRVTATAENGSDRDTHGLTVLFDIFDENGKFLANCKKESELVIFRKGTKENIEAVCELTKLQSKEANHATAKFMLR